MRKARARLCQAAIVASALATVTPAADAQVASLGKGHNLIVNSGLQIWGCDTGASSFTYNNLTNLNMNGVMWSFEQANAGVLSSGQRWGKWVNPNPSAGNYTAPANSLTGTENAHYTDLFALQVGDEQQSDLENPSGYTKAWFDAAHSGNYFTDKLMYVNSTSWSDVSGYFNFIAAANPDAISWDAYPFGTTGVYPNNWLGKAQFFRRSALGSYIGASGNAPRPYGLYLQTYHGGDGARDPGDLEMRWQQFTAWTMGYTFVDCFSVGGGTSLFNGANMSSPLQPRYDQFKETARQSKNLGPALVKLISYGYGPNIAVGQDPSGATNAVPIDWPVFSAGNAPPNQQYLTGVSAVNLGSKNGGHPGDVYVGFFNPLLTSYGDPAGTAYFMITNALGAYLQDPSLLVSDCIQQITLNFDFGGSGINSLRRLRRSDGQVETVPLTALGGSQYRLVFNLDGGTGDLFKYNDGSPFVGIEPPISALYWDNDGVAGGNNVANGAGLGGTGTWDTTASKWFNGAADQQWSANRDAVFWGTAGTVTLGAAQSVNSLQFKTTGYTIAGSTLTMSSSSISVDSNVTATISSTVAGSAGITKSGAGTLVLGNAANTYTGGTTISAGAVRVSSDGSLGPAPGSLTTNITFNGGTLQFGASFDLSNNRGIYVGAAGGTIDTQGFTNPSGYTQAEGIQGPGNLTKIGSGTFYMNTPAGDVNNNWTGNLVLKEGTWKINERGGLPYNANNDNVYRPGQVTFDGGTLQIDATITITSNYRGMTVDTGGGTFDTQGFNFTWGGPLVGNVPNANFNKIGSGTLQFNSAPTTGPATYSGNLNVNGGTLVINNGTAMGDLASINLANTAGVALSVIGVSETIGSLSGGGASGGSVTISGVTLITGGNNKTTTVAGVISGTGALQKSGTGAMVLTNANSYSGGTVVSGGILRVNNTSGSGTGSGGVSVTSGTLAGTGTVSGAVSVGNGGHLAPGSSAGTLTLSSGLTLSTGAVLDYELANVTTVGSNVNDLTTVTGNLTLGATLTLNLDAYQGDVTNGTYRLITYSGTLSGNTSGWSIGTTNASGPHGYTFSTATAGQINLVIINGTPTWIGTVSTSWSTGGNWNTAAEPSSTVDVSFPTPIPGTGATIALSSGELAKTLTFDDSYTLSGGDLTIAAATVSVAASKTVTISSVLAASAGISKSGAGTLVLGGANSYTGGTTISAGTLRVSGDGNLGNAAGGVTFTGGTLNTTASFSTARAVAVNTGGGTIDVNSGVTTTLAGAISGAAANTLVKAGSGTLVLNQPSPRSGTSSTWLGGVTVSSGTLKVGNGGSTGYLPGYDPIAYAGLPPTVPTISLAAGATLEFNHTVGGPTQDAAHAVVISGAGNVIISGAKTEVFVANNTYTGTTTINAGSTLRIGWGGALNSGGLGATAIANSGALTFSNDHNTTFPGSISGAGTLLKEFSGTAVFTGAAAHTSGTSITAGTLQIGDGGTTGSLAGNVTNSATLAFKRSDNITFAGIVSGVGVVAQRGSGTLVLSGAHTRTGGTVVNAGALQVSADSNLGAIPGSFTTGNITLDGGALRFGASFDISNNRGIALGAADGTIDTQGFSTVSGYNATAGGFTGDGDLTKLGSGTFFAAATSAGANTTWKGRLIIKEGVWKIVGSDGLPYNVPAPDGLQAEQVTLDGGTWQIAAALSITNGRRGITVAAGGGTIDTPGVDLTWPGPMAGNITSAVLNKTGSGILRFTGANSASTYSGIFNINAGTLRLDNGNTMGDLASINLANVAGATLNVTGNETIGSLSGGGASGGEVTLSTVTLTTGGNNTTTTFAGAISGFGGLVKTGNGVMSLTGNNSYTGSTTISAGTLAANGAAALGASTNAIILGGGTLKATATFSTSRPLAITGNSIIDATGNTLTIDGTGNTTIIGNLTVSGGTLTLARTSGPINVTPGATFTVSPGATLNLGGSVSALSDGVDHVNVLNNFVTTLNVTAGSQMVGNIDGVGNTTVAAGASLTASRIRQNALTVNGTATLRTGGAAGASDIDALTFGASGKLNLADGRLISQSDIGTWNGSDYTGLTGDIKRGRNGGAWNGTSGIITNLTAAQGATALTTIAIAAASDIGRVGLTFGTVPVVSGDVMMMYTYAGDANLSGFIDGDDFFQIDTGYQNSWTGYEYGDFNYDGNVDADDYFVIDRNYPRQTTHFSSGPVFEDGSGLAGATAVPEPAHLAWLSFAAAACVRNRRRRAK